MTFDFPAAIGSLKPEQRLRFYELLAHNLTVGVRSVWSSDNVTDGEKVDRMKWMNEIMHRVTAKAAVLRLNLHDWTEADTWEMIESYVAENKSIGGEVMAAVRYSYEAARDDGGRV